ncbi:MAG: hypothetical protein IIV87_00690, partial [Oscillospiraceae bacterium]|nr:hypothetical protein [Oscillospiraceae bacterium]
ETWTPGTDIDGYFLRYKVAGRTAGYAPVAETIEPGEKTHLTLRYDAPNREDNYSVQVQMVYLSKGSYKPFGDKVSLRADTDNSLGVKNAQILSVTAPEEMPEGTKGEIAVEVLNIGTMTWDSKVVLAEQNAKAYMSRTGAADDMQALASAVGIEPGVEVAAGERYIFRFDLHTWTNSNTYAVYEAPGTTISQNLRMAVLAGEHAGTFGDEFEIKSLVTQIPVESDLIVYADADDVEMSGQTRSYEIISASVPTQMNGSQIAPITFTVKNTGNTAWVKHDGQFALHKMRLAMDSENYEFGLYTDLNGVTYHSGNRDRIDIVSGETVMPGEVYTFSAFLKAPAYTGYYKIELRLTADGVGPEFSQQTKGDSKVYGIRVDGTTLKGEDIYTNEGIMYQDAKNDSFTYSQLASADMYIAEKAFFFDLWIDDTSTPIDDRWQPLGTDERILRELLNSQRKRAQAYEEGKDPWNKITGELGTGTFVVDGFPPWWLKYSGISDPLSSYADSASEQLFVDFIGEYGGWMDADAAGTVSLANCSIFSKLELQVGEYAKKITQTQPEFDKSVGDPSVVYDPNTTYIVFFMGDWDGSAWNGNRMHA